MQDEEDKLPPPKFCDNCCSVNIELTENRRIYGRNYGERPYIYYCNDCKAAVGCHPNTFRPLGKMSDRATRKLRSKAHEQFDRIWKSGLMSRSKAYAWLAGRIGIEVKQCHVSWLTKEQLVEVAEVSRQLMTENLEILIRRKEKQDERNAKNVERRRTKKRVEGERRTRQKRKRLKSK